MYDYSKLRGRMKEKRFTREELAKAIGISDAALGDKLNNRRQFKQDEMIKIIDVLKIDVGDIIAYFYAS